MIKKPWKVVAVLALSIFALTSNFNLVAALANDDIYEKHYQVDLRNLNISLQNDTIQVSKKNVPISEKLKQIKDADVFEKQLLTNEKFVEDLKLMVKNEKTPISIGVAEAEFIKTLDDEGNVISSRPLTNKEVANEKYSNLAYATNGQTQYYDTLSLYTSISGSSPTYWVQSNAYWSNNQTSDGREALGVTWEDGFRADNDSTTTIQYTNGNEGASLSDFEPYRGAVWNFHDSVYAGGGYWNFLKGAYVGLHVTRSEPYGYHYFTSEYVHTYTTTSWQASVEFDGTALSGASVQLSPSIPQSWKLKAYIGGNF